MRVLLTGATGFVGLTLARRLVARGDAVRALVRPTSVTADLEGLGVELCKGSVEDAASLSRAVEGNELVFHVAGAVKALHTRDLFRVNAEGTRLVAEACVDASSSPVLVHVSSLAASGPSSGKQPRTETDTPAPVSAYGASKLQGERAVRALAATGNLQATIVRPPVVYGPRDLELVPQLAQMARLGLVLRMGFGAKRYSIVHVADLCDGLLAAAERGHRLGRAGSEGIYFLDSGTEHTWDEIALAACEAWGRTARVIPVPEVTGLLAASVTSLLATVTQKPNILSFDKLKELRQAAWTCNSDRAVRELSFQPKYQLREGMQDAISWYRSQQGSPAGHAA